MPNKYKDETTKNKVELIIGQDDKNRKVYAGKKNLLFFLFISFKILFNH